MQQLSPSMSSDTVSPMATANSKLVTSADGKNRTVESPNAPSPQSMARRTESVIRLEVYGVASPPKPMMDEFLSMLETNIANLTLAVISTLLARNITLKLSQQDADFILPAQQKPFVRLEFLIPNDMQQLHVLMSLLRHGMQAFVATNNNPELVTNLQQHYSANWNTQAEVSSRSK
jgi:hypothetical protein